MRYFMRWPVLDIDRTLSDLHAEATDDLAEELEKRNLVADGPIDFQLEDLNLDGVELHASVEVRDLGPHYGRYLRGKRKAAA